MENDFSKTILDKYFETQACLTSFFLKNGQEIKGYIVGYFYNEIEEGTVFQWHILPEKHKNLIGQGPAEVIFGQYILQMDIEKVYFFEGIREINFQEKTIQLLQFKQIP